MIELLDNISLGMLRVSDDIPSTHEVLQSVSAAVAYPMSEYPVDDEIIGSISLPSATELVDMRTKIVRTDIW